MKLYIHSSTDEDLERIRKTHEQLFLGQIYQQSTTQLSSGHYQSDAFYEELPKYDRRLDYAVHDGV